MVGIVEKQDLTDKNYIGYKLSLDQARKIDAVHYFTGNPCKRGHISLRYTKSKLCLECSNFFRKKYENEMADEEKEERRKKDRNRSGRRNRKEYHKKWSEKNREHINKYAKDYYAQNRDRVNKRIRDWQKSEHERHRSYCRKWEQNNKGKVAEKCRRRQIRKLLGCPKDEKHKKEIEKIYENCPKGMHVDHIIPINSPTVCGLHVPWNLQYLTPQENGRKSNNYEP